MPQTDEPLATLLRRAVQRVEATVAGEERLRSLLDAVTAVGGNLDLAGTLERIVEAAAALSGAQYAALGVLSPDGVDLSEFVTYGLDDETKLLIGAPPRGRGVLGQLITDQHPLRLSDISQHPASFGFPANHPAMTSFLGVPIRARDRAFGNLYLTEKGTGGPFTAEDEQAVLALAAAAGVAIENAVLFGEAQRRERWLNATAQIQRALLGNPSATEGLAMVAEHAREVTEGRVALIVLQDYDGDLVVEAASGCDDRVVGTQLARIGTLQDVVDQGLTAHLAEGLPTLGLPDLEGALVVPFTGPGGAGGALVVGTPDPDRHHFELDDVAALSGFANQAAIALSLAQAREDRASLMIFSERDRIARDLHDVVIQRLFATGLTLQGISRQDGRPEVTDKLAAVVLDLDATIRDIRTTIFELSRSDETADLRAQINDVLAAAQASLKLKPHLVVEGPIDTLVPDSYRPHLVAVLIEALSNISRHAKASRVDVRVAVGDDSGHRCLTVVIRDDGVGISEKGAESGLANMRDRAESFGGALRIESEPGEGTALEWRVPLTD